MWFGFILSLLELFSFFFYFCTKRDPRSRHKLINDANLLAIRVEQIIVTNYDQVSYVRAKFQVNR